MIENLEWDSEFFNLKIGRVFLNSTMSFDKVEWKKLREKFKNEGYNLIYLIVQPSDSNANNVLIESNELLIDKKTTLFCSDFESSLEFEFDSVQSYTSRELTPELISLTLQSGEYSRFKLDEKFGIGYFEKLYTRWIENSVSKVIADEIITYCIGKKIVGLLTLSYRLDGSDIGLLAVDSSHRGKGIASQLIKKAFSLSTLKGINRMKVVTQLDNHKAISLYEKNGFFIHKVENIYHVWI